MAASPLPAFLLDIATGPGIEVSREGAATRIDIVAEALSTSGVGNVFRVDTDNRLKSLRGGVGLLIQANRTNTGPATLVVDGVERPLLDAGGNPQIANRIVEGRFYQVLFDAGTEAWRVQAGASTLDEIPGLIDLQDEVAGAVGAATDAAALAQSGAQTAIEQAAQTSLDRNAVSDDRAATSALRDATANDRIAVNALVGGNLVSSGERLGLLASPNLGLSNGAVAITAGGLNVGFTVPQGSTGNTSFYTPFTPLTAAEVAKLTGRTLRLKAVFDVTAGFTTAKPLNPTIPAQVRRSGSTLNVGTQVSVTLNGTKLTKVVDYTVTAGDTAVGVCVQLASSASTAQAYSLQVASLSYLLLDDLVERAISPADDMLGLQGAAQATQAANAVVAPRRFGIGPVYEDATIAVQALGGAVNRANSAGRVIGFTIPVGQNGASALIQVLLPMDIGDSALMAGRTLQVTAGFDTSTDFARTFNALWAGHTLTVLSNRQISANRRQVVFTTPILGTETTFNPYWQKAGTTLETSEVFVALTDLSMEIVASPSDTLPLAEENARVLTRRTVRGAAATAIDGALNARRYAATVTVRKDGTGQFTSIPAALASITDASIGKRYEIVVGPGAYPEVNWFCKDYVDIRGVDRALCILAGSLLDSVDPATITATQTCWLTTISRLSHLTITARNMRYPIHADASNVPASFDKDLGVFDCHVEHLGNDGARAYQSANGGSPDAVWNSEFPIGYGASSGMTYETERCTLIGARAGGQGHTRGNFARPSVQRMRNNIMIAKNTDGHGLFLQPLGSRLTDTVELIGNRIVGPITVAAYPWYPTALADQVADRHEYRITGYGNSPVPFQSLPTGTRALRIDSADTSNASAVAISGSAVIVLFGGVISVRGGGGLQAGVYGTADVSGVGTGPSATLFITSLGQRLGNRTGSPLALSVAFQGNAPIVVTFDQDYTAQSNATILSAINTALGGAGTASLDDVMARFRPTFSDEETGILNTSATAIRRRQAVAYDTSTLTGRLMTASDPASRFAGIALEDIRPGEFGRVKERGAVRIAVDVDRSDSGTFTFGDTFGVGPTPGRLVKSPSISLLTAYSSLDARWERKFAL